MKSPYKQIEINGRHINEHRYLMEQKVGRKLKRNEYVHHINGDKLDNRIENLMIMSPQEHNELHKTKLPKTKICIVCGKVFEPPIKHRRRNVVCSRECWLINQKKIATDNAKNVNQFSKNGELIKTWSSLHEIERQLGFTATNICKCCNGKIKSAYGYIWRYE